MSSKDKHRTFVWEYFDRGINYYSRGVADEAKCKKIDVVMKCTGGSASGLLRYLKSKHSM